MRIDAYLSTKKIYPSRTKAAEAVSRGEVRVSGKVVLKPSYEVSGDEDISLSQEAENFVSNGGYKLEKAICDFGVSVEGFTCLDIGASTGGFTDCLLRRGAKKVYALDVGKSLLDKSVADDPRVVAIDNFNARELNADTFCEKFDMVVCDVSFISLTYVLKQIYDVLSPDGVAITLVKPQFECGKKALNGKGIVKNPENRRQALKKIYDFGLSLGLTPTNCTIAPVKPDKNVEYLYLWTKKQNTPIDFLKIQV